MRGLVGLILAVTTQVELVGGGPQEALGPSSSYSAAFYSSPAGSLPELVVFPMDRSAVRITLPLKLDGVAYSPDGSALYGSEQVWGAPKLSQLYRVALNPIQVSALPGSLGLSSGAGLTVSSGGDRVLVSGRDRHSASVDCGLFELSIPDGKLRRILKTADCDYRSTWHSLSFSPNGSQAVAILKADLFLIDLDDLTTRSLGDGFARATWSPDGKWIAAIENGGKWRTMLLDTKDFKIRKMLRPTEAQWSPDSRYLLAMRPDFCGPYFSTIVAVDIESGKGVTIKSSKCKVNQATIGWVRSDIVP
jgi:WD40 repeat protein